MTSDRLGFRFPRVVYWNNMPAPYMVDRFNALADRGDLQFEVWFNERRAQDRDWEVEELHWRFNYRYLPSLTIAGFRIHCPAPSFGAKPDLIFSLYAEPVFVIGWLIARMRGIHTGFRVLRTFESWVHRRAYKERLKRAMFERADAIETAGADGAAYAIACGARAERVFVCTHTVNEAFFRTDPVQDEQRRVETRERLGLKGVTFTYVGRLWKGKGLDTLLRAFQRVQSDRTEDMTLMLVGEGADAAILKEECRVRGIDTVVFAGYAQRRVLPEFLRASDVFVFPTLGDPYGLAVDEAMACGLPIIATEAAGEIRDRVHDGVNGYVVPPGNDEALAARMSMLAYDAKVRTRMGAASTSMVETRTPDRWAAEFRALVDTVLELSPRQHTEES